MSLSATCSDISRRDRGELRTLLLIVWAAAVVASVGADLEAVVQAAEDARNANKL